MTVYEQLLVVQEHDTKLDQLQHRLDQLPEREAVRAAEAALADLEAEVAEVRDRRDALARDQKRLEDEVTLVDDKLGEVSSTMYSGSVTAPRELQALQDEIAALERRKRSLEDDELELMEASEPLDAALDALAERRVAQESARTAAAEALTAVAGEIEAEIAQVRTDRDAAAASVGDDLLAEYERLRPQLGGVAIARLSGTTCGGCHLSLSAVEADQIRKQPADARVTCEECGRLLVR